MPPSPPKPLTPQMQSEVDALVFKPKRGGASPAAAPAATSPSPYMVQAHSAEPTLVNQARAYAGKDVEDHFNTSGMTMKTGGETNAFDIVYSTAHAHKDTEDHFGHGMNMADDNSTMMAFDRVYDSRFTEKDSARLPLRTRAIRAAPAPSCSRVRASTVFRAQPRITSKV